MVPDIIQAIGVAIAGVLAAWNARQAKQIADLRVDMQRLQTSELESRRLLRSAVRNIRDWIRWDASGRVGPPPSIPDDLRDEV
ncbi:hypothetical protein ACFTSD_01575 [Nocardiaceae bacterium NPDC056970]